MFYGAFDEKTAVKETFNSARNNNEVITVGQFRTAREFPVVDLTRAPSVPSIFDSARRDSRPDMIFLNHFMRDFQASVTKDGREHIDYVPTQIVTEYIRHLYSHPDLGIVRGVLYRSARARGNVVSSSFIMINVAILLRNGQRSKSDIVRISHSFGLDWTVETFIV